MKRKDNIVRLHIGLFGRRNTGKSSIINLLAGQNLSIVSDIPGTTTDPVKKAVEIPGLGAVTLIDTGGIDDTGELGGQRINKARQAIKQVDVAVIVFSGNDFSDYEQQLAEQLHQLNTPFILLHNKSDILPVDASIEAGLTERYKADFIDFSTITGDNIEKLIQLLQKNIPGIFSQVPPLFGDLVKPGDLVMLVTPIDSEAPEGRLILPQVQAIREALDFNCIAVVLKETEVEDFIRRTSIIPSLVITDSQLFGKIDKLIASEIPLTSFSILLARQKGNFEAYLKGTPQIDNLHTGDRILIMESCTHHSTCDDIGRVKIPRMLQDYTGHKLEFDIVSGLDETPRHISDYALVLQCGGCMITRKQLLNRIQTSINANVPVTNYGMAIAYVNGVWKRSVELFENSKTL